ncbi:TldD/PmbA family protein [Anaeromyxobacter terrae]|uniref:TldD/PmbA family protein n=1 Tax=Anaeromyxobacter terrae TaxID=2925406 RepID=UPI001F5A8BDD|nr:metallopeptidase TldD-related protein [Anaeromyxobacter sp. SG22]
MLAAVLAVTLAVAAAPAASNPPAQTIADERLATLGAMQAELSRSMERLRIEGYDAPYFIAYQVSDVTRHQIGARFGALFEDDARRDRNLFVDLRVGSYELDSSAPEEGPFLVVGEGPSWYAPKEAPLEGDTTALRNALWLATDEKLKEALSSYFKKRSRQVYRQDEPDRPSSFTREAPSRHVDAPLPFPLDRDRWKSLAREATARFRAHPAIFDASLKISAEKQVRWFASSEGSALVTERTLYGVHLQAVTRAPDGQLLEDGRDFYARTEGALPSATEVLEAVDAVAAELEALRKAPAIDPYTGPAILEPEAAGVLFHEAVGHRLEGERVDDDKEGQTFKGQVGQQILPAFLSIVDDPTLPSVAGTALNGSYAFDDQGVAAQRTVLVKDGRLATYLLSRKPVRPFERSNGHGRSQGGRSPTARMANLVVESRRAVSRDELKHLLMKEARRQGKPYGLVIRDVTGGDTNTMSYGYQAFKGTPRLVYRVDARTGKEELVRGVELVGTPLTSVNKVMATSRDVKVFNGYCGAESGYVPVSTVAPAALVGEIELQRVARANERSPILPAPWSEAPSAAPPRAPGVAP